MRIDEKHLAQLAAVVEAGGVTEGANLLGLSQPAVSRTLSTLEKRLGEPLFLPGRRPLVPRVLGQQIAAHGRMILEAGRKASEAIVSFQAGSAGTVRIGGVPFFMDAFISRMIGQFQMQEPDIQIISKSRKSCKRSLSRASQVIHNRSEKTFSMMISILTFKCLLEKLFKIKKINVVDLNKIIVLLSMYSMICATLLLMKLSLVHS